MPRPLPVAFPGAAAEPHARRIPDQRERDQAQFRRAPVFLERDLGLSSQASQQPLPLLGAQRASLPGKKEGSARRAARSVMLAFKLSAGRVRVPRADESRRDAAETRAA